MSGGDDKNQTDVEISNEPVEATPGEEEKVRQVIEVCSIYFNRIPYRDMANLAMFRHRNFSNIKKMILEQILIKRDVLQLLNISFMGVENLGLTSQKIFLAILSDIEFEF